MGIYMGSFRGIMVFVRATCFLHIYSYVAWSIFLGCSLWLLNRRDSDSILNASPNALHTWLLLMISYYFLGVISPQFDFSINSPSLVSPLA